MGKKIKNMCAEIFIIGGKYPIYDSDDNIIGKTSPDDVIIVTYHHIPSMFDEDKDEYIHAEIIYGEHKGYDRLQLNEKDGDFENLKKKNY